jgi:hypothetical protein
MTDPEVDYEGNGCPSGNDKTHIHVAVGQNFQVEWSVGHGKRQFPHYWRMFHKDKMSSASRASESTLDNYLRRAPANSKMVGDDYRRIHMGAARRPEFGATVRDSLSRIDPKMIAGRKKTKANDKFKQELTSSQRARDQRVEYDNGMFIHVSKFPASPVEYQQDHELTHMRVPKGTKPGKIVLMWNWKGNKDCINIQAYPENQPVASELIHAGRPISSNGRTEPPTPVTYKYKRLDHCRIPNPSKVRDCKIVSNDVQECMNACNRAGYANCQAVAVVPAENPRNKFPFNVLGDSLLPTECQSLNTQPGDYVCYSSIPTKQEGDKEKRFVFAETDAMNPGFYGTCWDRVESDNYADGAQGPRLDHRVSGQCRKCSDTGPFSFNDNSVIRWEDKLIPESSCQAC